VNKTGIIVPKINLDKVIEMVAIFSSITTVSKKALITSG
jgi:hypothetical protein